MRPGFTTSAYTPTQGSRPYSPRSSPVVQLLGGCRAANSIGCSFLRINLALNRKGHEKVVEDLLHQEKPLPCLLTFNIPQNMCDILA